MAWISKPAYEPACLTDPLTESNCYIFTSHNRALLIDPNNSDLIIPYLKEKELILETIVLTHEHCDHIGGLNTLRSSGNVQVIASKPCSDGIQSTKINMTRMMESYLYFKSNGKLRVSYPRFTCQPADRSFSGTNYMFSWHNFTFHCLLVPGHTPGSTCITVNGTMLFSGDYFIPGEDVITRLPGGDEQAYEQIGKQLLRELPTPIWTYPGHGLPFILTEEVKQHYGLY